MIKKILRTINKWKAPIIAIPLYIAIGFSPKLYFDFLSSRAQDGFIPINKISDPYAKDKDRDGKYETYINIQDKSYALILDEQNRPVLRSVETRLVTTQPSPLEQKAEKND